MQPLSIAAVLTTPAPNSVTANLLPFFTCPKEKPTRTEAESSVPCCCGNWSRILTPCAVLKEFPCAGGAA